MLNLTSLAFAFGLVTLVTVAPSSQSPVGAATMQHRLTLPRIAGNLSAQKLAPIKRSIPLGTTVIDRTVVSAPPAKKSKSSPEVPDNQPMSLDCRRELDARPMFSSNERPVPNLNNPANLDRSNNFPNNLNQGGCNFSIPIYK
jgi:hypothetical protein